MAFIDTESLFIQVSNDFHGRHVGREALDDCSQLLILRKHVGVAFQIVFCYVSSDERVGVWSLGKDAEFRANQFCFQFQFGNLLQVFKQSRLVRHVVDCDRWDVKFFRAWPDARLGGGSFVGSVVSMLLLTVSSANLF
ncbi:hypothetical protein TNCT_569201 [Trichonephila clavata]|uniref:Uncharacterized protein n=1 Tax=Trichonephila clavata TaxID=2740835 RepID=A0A8X6LDS6_TRICU|nr:hypothetical protein TNCT_569201 [Trichonephila clavata]